MEESICYLRGARSILSLLFYFWWKILLANNADPDQMPHYVASDLSLHCLPMTLLQVSREEWNKSWNPLKREVKTKMAELLPLKMFHTSYRKNSKNWDTLNYYRDCPTNGIVGFYSAILRSKDADRITNRVDTDQTAPWGAVWSGSALFAQTYLSQYFQLLRYYIIFAQCRNT